MPQDTGGILNLKIPVGSDDIRLQTIGIDLPYNFQKIDDAFTAHQAESAQKHITESGENENGRYIKFDDGTMICTHRIEVGSRIAYGTGTSNDPYRTNLVTWTFPAAFATTPIICGTGRITAETAAARANTFNFSGVSTTTANSLQLFMLSNNSTDAICTIHVIAIGRWK